MRHSTQFIYYVSIHASSETLCIRIKNIFRSTDGCDTDSLSKIDLENMLHVLVLRKPLGGTGSTLRFYLLGKNQQLQLLESSTEVSRQRDVTLNYLEHHFSHTLIQRHP